MKQMIYFQNTELPIDFRDCGPWRSYHMDASGSDEHALMQSALIAEVDQDGGEINCYSLEDAPNDVYNSACELIREALKKRDQLREKKEKETA